MKISIAITTYNRKEYLYTVKRSVEAVKNIKRYNIRIYDDCSIEYDIDFLWSIFPNASEIKRRSSNLGADANMRQVFLDFLDTTDDALFMLDSDLICHPDCMEKIEGILGQTDGILSIYNSTYHKGVDTLIIDDERCQIKKSVGAAGLVMVRSMVQRIVDNCPLSRTYDWDLSNYLLNNKIRLIVTERSYVQHIGIHGTNTGSSAATDFGFNFYLTENINEKILIDFFQELILAKDKIIAELPSIVRKNVEVEINTSLEYRIIKILIIPARKLKNIMNKIIGKKQKRA